MTYDHGYGELENKLIGLLRSGPPDFEAAEELLRRGADVNAVGKHDDENVLSGILHGYGWPSQDDAGKQNADLYAEPGAAMCAVIRFFLDHGFDVNRCDGCFGAQCLCELTLTTFDRSMIEATKILFDAGARNRTISPASTSPWDTPQSFIASEGGSQLTCDKNPATGNIFEAAYQVYEAVEEGRPYRGIDSYEMAVGKRVRKVLAESDGVNPVFFAMDRPAFKKDNCYTATLCFVYDGGVLVTTKHLYFWTDTGLPDARLIDVSEHFDGVVGSVIKKFRFGYRTVKKGTTHYGQPITTIVMDSGRKIRFSTNFGNVAKEETAAFFELL